jgi:hypothetical protein
MNKKFLQNTNLQFKFDFLMLEPWGLPKVHKLALVKLVSEQLIKIFNISKWGIGSIPRVAFSKVEKDNDLVMVVQIGKVAYTKHLWDVWVPKLMMHETSKKMWQVTMEKMIKHHK